VIVAAGYTASGDPNQHASYVGAPADPGWTDVGKGLVMLDAKTGQVVAKVVFDAADPVLSRMKYAIPSTPAVLDLDFDEDRGNYQVRLRKKKAATRGRRGAGSTRKTT